MKKLTVFISALAIVALISLEAAGVGDRASIPNTISKHLNSPAKVYPTVGAGGAGWVASVNVTSSATAGTFGDYTEIIPANTVTSQFDIHYFNVETITSYGVAECIIASGAALSEVEIARVRFSLIGKPETTTAVPTGLFNVPVMMNIQPANTRISMKCAPSLAEANVITLSVSYHTY